MVTEDPWRLDRQVSVVIGAAGGIGSAVCRELVSRGSCVVATDIDPTVHDVASSLGRESAGAVCGDARHRDVLREAMRAAAELPGELRVLVHATWADARDRIDELTDEEWERVQETCVTSAWRAAQVFVQALDGAPGSAVFVSSVHAYGAFEHCSPYGVAKAGLLALVRSLAVELGPGGLRANAVAPGFVPVRRNQDVLDDGYRETLRRQYPLRRFAAAEDVARAIVFLASPAAGYITGTCLPVDGGLLAHTSQRG